MTSSITFLSSGQAASERMIARRPAWVVHAETSADLFVELDADDQDHAHRLAAHWVTNGLAMTAAAHRVFPDGSLGPVNGRIYCDL